MTSVVLPLPVGPWKATPRLVDFGIDAISQTGAGQQRVGRLGTRYAVEFTDLPAYDGDFAAALLGAVLEARTLGQTVTASWPATGLGKTLGAPLVNGANQLGSTLTIDGVTARHIKPRFFSFVQGGRNYLHMVTRQVTADALGNAVLNIAPMLRVAPSDNTALEFVNPQIEGFIQGTLDQWTLERLTGALGFSFTIQEAQ